MIANSHNIYLGKDGLTRAGAGGNLSDAKK
jgi:hypothetical protein